MTNTDEKAFMETIAEGYATQGGSIILGSAMFEGKPISNLFVSLPLATLNRHGLVAGATGTGKTKTLQRMSEQLSLQGVPVLLMDIKGDMSGISRPGSLQPKIEQRHRLLGIPWNASTYPVEFLGLGAKADGVKLRATVSEFGPVLFSRILELNDTQGGVVSMVFKYCDDNGLPLLDLEDFKTTMQYLTREGKEEVERMYGTVSPASTGTIMRKLIELEGQGAEQFFGEISFDVSDLIRHDSNGRGYLSVLRLMDMQTKPKLFSTFMLSLLAEIYQKFPEEGDMEKPKLVIVIDEAHLVFDDASDALLDQLETVIKLIRSKGISIIFCTQNPQDVPDAILAQLGFKIQHALRAFTAKDREVIKKASENYPETVYYEVSELLTQLGMGEALVTALNEKGIPTPLAHTMLSAPETRMDTITSSELEETIQSSSLVSKYGEVVDRESASEILSKKLESLNVQVSPETQTRGGVVGGGAVTHDAVTMVTSIAKSTVARQVGRQVAREITRGLLGALFGAIKKR